jgi:hypothetical protein
MKIREAELRDAAAMARVSVDSYRAAHRNQIPEESLMQFTYEESERNWTRAIREFSEVDERQEYIYIAENAEGLVIGVAMGGPERLHHPLSLYRRDLFPLSASRIPPSGHRAPTDHQCGRAPGRTGDALLTHPGLTSECPGPPVL